MDREVGSTAWAKRLLAGALLAVTGTAPVAAQCGYEISAIIQPPSCPPPLNEPPATIPTSMNELGEVVGYHHRCLAAGTVPFFWSPETGLVDLPIPAGFDEGQAWDINGAGDIVGSLRMNNRYHATLWRAGEVIDLGWMPGGNYSQASAINEGGIVVGSWGNDVRGPTHAFVWRAGVMTDLGPSLGTPRSQATDVSEIGNVVGWRGSSFMMDGAAYVWRSDGATALRLPPGGFFTIASSINKCGKVAGWGLIQADGLPVGLTRAFLWDDGEVIELGALPGHLRSGALDVSDVGQVVGRSWNVDGNPNISHGFIWQDGVLMNVNDLIPADANLIFTHGWAINDSGEIAGQAKTPQNTVLSVLLSPLEPVGDINIDCEVGVADLVILLDHWAQTYSPADLNGDGVVNVLDLIILLLNFGS